MNRHADSCSPRRLALLSTMLAAGLASVGALAQQAPTATTTPTPGFASRQVLVAPISGIDERQVVLVAVTLEPGASSPPHQHPGNCYGTVLEGVIELFVQGEPARRLSAGESYAGPGAQVAHMFTNVGERPVRLLNALIVEKGKPATTPAPMPAR